MATRRCRRLIDEGRVRLVLADSAHIPYPDGFFDKAFAIHTIYFWSDPTLHLRELHRVLRHGGRLVLGFHTKDAAAASFPETVYTFHAADDVQRLLELGGFDGIRTSATSTAGGVCLVAGQRPPRVPGRSFTATDR